jgi:TRAP transporter TAXI family solute receptor
MLMFLLSVFLFSPFLTPIEAKMPELIVWTTYDVGTSTYMQTACMADGVIKKTGLKLRILPSGNDFGRLIPVRSGTAHFSVMSGVSAYAGAYGLWDYGKYEWGPQPFRQILSVIDWEQGISVAVSAGSNIKTLKDLKGKRVTYVPGATSINVCMEATLAFAGLTWNDVVKIPAPSLGTSMKFIGEGKTDAAWASTTSPVMYEVERSPHGVYWPEYPTDDKAGWERMLKIAPFVVPVSAIKGVGVSPEKPRKLISYAYPFILAYENLDEDLVYEMTKAIDASFDLYQKCHLVMPFWNFKKATNLKGMVLPYHKGTIKYLKETGLWDNELEKRQNALIKDQTAMKKLWDEALSEATAKKIKDEAFSEFWTKKATEVLK